MKSYNDRKLQRQHARMATESATNVPPNSVPVRMSLRTGLPSGNLSNRDVADKKRTDERGQQTRRTKKVKITLAPTPWDKS